MPNSCRETELSSRETPFSRLPSNVRPSLKPTKLWRWSSAPAEVGRQCLLIAGTILFLILGRSPAFGYGVGCPYCTPEPDVVASTTPLLHTSIKWCGIAEAPAIANPAIALVPITTP